MNKYPCEVCGFEMKILDKHHIHSISKGGSNCPSNRCRICPNCHRLVHTGIIILEGRFATTKGNMVIWRYKGQPSVTGIEDPPVYLYSELQQISEIKDASDSKT